jgi:hypothetical protein
MPKTVKTRHRIYNPNNARHYWQTLRPHPYKSVGFNIGPSRKYRKHHSSKTHEAHSMTDAPMTATSDKKRKLQEAELIPGLGPLQYGFPNSIITKMRYGELITMSTTALVPLKSYHYRANSAYDPDFTSIGHQPMYYDQYSAIYDQYVVLGAKITVQFMTAGAQNVIVGINQDDDSTTLTTLSILLEQNNSVSTVLAGTNSDNCTLSMVYSPMQAFGVDAKSDGASQISVGANPTEETYWLIWATCQDTTSAQTINALIDIEYTVKFSEL